MTRRRELGPDAGNPRSNLETSHPFHQLNEALIHIEARQVAMVLLHGWHPRLNQHGSCFGFFYAIIVEMNTTQYQMILAQQWCQEVNSHDYCVHVSIRGFGPKSPGPSEAMFSDFWGRKEGRCWTIWRF